MRRPPRVLLPRRRQWSWWAIAASVVIHALLLSLKAYDWFWEDGRPPEVTFIPLLPDIPPAELQYRVPPERRLRPRPEPPAPVEQPVAEAEVAPAAEAAAAEPAAIVAAPEDTTADLPSITGTGRQRVPRLRPALGEGKLWVQPLPLAPRELAQRLTRSHYELVDSAVTAIVQAYLDSVLAAPTPFDNKPPSWTTKIAGKTFGIDSRNIYIGDFKIPTAILALLPIPQVAAVDLQAARRMSDIRADLAYAAQRSQTMDDFKRAIREIRERRQRELEFERSQRSTPADTGKKP